MKIGIEWLKEYVDIRERPEELKDALTMSALLVESISEADGDAILEVEVTSNRPDCLSYIGIAREIAALFDRPLKPPPATEKLRIRGEQVPYRIDIKEPNLCPRYVGLLMDGIQVKSSPLWMQRRLEMAGTRPLNNIVDITNYVLLEMGHPLHAFDFRRLRKGRIVVARAKQGQRFRTLDGIERELDGDMLLINDGVGPVAIAGVMGGLDSEIIDSTEAVLLECAYFNPLSVRRTAKKLGLSTEASYRFERGADWGDAVRAIGRACHLIQELAGGKIAGSVQDVYPKKIKPARIVLRRRRAEALLGVKLKDSFVVSTLKRLQFEPVRKAPGTWEVVCPSYRADMELEADLIEDLARFHGYQNIPTTLPASKSPGIVSSIYASERAARRILHGLGYCEGVNLSFASETEHRQFPHGEGDRIRITNPLTEDTQFLRTMLAPGLVRTAQRNFNHDIHNVRVFEIGKVYRSANARPVERTTLGILGSGGFAGFNWRHPSHPSNEYDFFHLKGVVSALLRGMRSAPAEVIAAPEISWLSPANASILVIGGKRLGVLGSLHPALEEEFRLKQPIYLAEIDFEELSQVSFAPIEYQPLAKYPAAERDLSVVVSKGIAYSDIRTGILGLRITELISIDLVDIYEGEKIPSGKLSLTLRFAFQDRDKTLTVDRVQSFSDNILAFLRATYGAERR